MMAVTHAEEREVRAVDSDQWLRRLETFLQGRNYLNLTLNDK